MEAGDIGCSLMIHPMPVKSKPSPETRKQAVWTTAYFVDEEYLVTALVPSDTACLANSPGRIRRTLQRVSDKCATEILGSHTRFGSLGTRWWTSCCMRQAWKPQWPHARRCLVAISDWSRWVQHVDRIQHTVDERVQNRHGTVGDTSIGVHLLQDWVGLAKKVRGQTSNQRVDQVASESGKQMQLTLVDVRRVRLLPGLGALLLVTTGGSLLAGILLLRCLGGSGGSLGGGLLVSGLGGHFGGIVRN